MQSENCNAYHKDKYEVICDPDGHSSNGKTRTYLFHIKSVSWTDRGKWICLLSASSSDIFLEVYASLQILNFFFPMIYYCNKDTPKLVTFGETPRFYAGDTKKRQLSGQLVTALAILAELNAERENEDRSR
ncbi:hypothetical protein ACTXT7_014029 [Hymenolepis weldensis]